MRSIALAAVLMTWISIGYSQTLTTAQARAHDGESATVRTVGNEHTAMASQGKPTFIDLDSAFPEQKFALVVWDQDRET